jgi:branched-chain amino acid aminotransferase
MKSDFVWHQGQLVNYEDATVHFLNASMHYGLAVFEGIRAYQTDNGLAVFRLKDHLKRLADSAKIMGLMSLPYSVEEMYQATMQVLRANNFADCYIRPLIYIVDGAWNLILKDIRVECSIAAWSWDKYMGEEAIEKGIRAKISSFSRHYVNAAMTKGKISGNYINSVLARSEVNRTGYDEAILLDHNGFVSECTGQNILLVRDGIIYTPPKYSILEGITRDTIINLAEFLDYQVKEELISRDQLYIADELFMVGTANEVIGIREVDDRQIGRGYTGEVTKVFQREYEQLVRGRLTQFSKYLDFVNMESEVMR